MQLRATAGPIHHKTALFFLFAALLNGLVVRASEPPSTPATSNDRYLFRQVHDPDGIGKFYLGREIAQVMGHEGADWLERPERETEEQPDKLVERLELKPGQVVADIGAGTGYLSQRLASRLGPSGKVLAEDIQPQMLQILQKKMSSLGISNVVSVLGTESDPKLRAGSVDLVLMVDVYHEFEFPYEMMSAIVQALKPSGRVVLVEYRAEDPKVPIKRLHKMTQAQVRKEMAELSLVWLRTDESLPQQHILVFGQPKVVR